MKQVRIRLLSSVTFWFVYVFILLSPLPAAVYEASTLHDAVARSETVQDLFFNRWDLIHENTACFDLFGILNWVPGYSIRTLNRGTGQIENVDMTLVRTYGSVTAGYPLLKGYDFEGLKSLFSSTGSAEDVRMKPVRDPEDPFLAFTATGFHYGLTRSVEINRGAAGSETVSDYKYSQFFDDMFALSLVWNPWVCVHTGVILNREIIPNADGTMDYGNSASSRLSYMASCEIYSLVALKTSSLKKEIEAFSMSVKLLTLLNLVMENPNVYIPEMQVSYRVLRRYNDEDWEPVWVNIPYSSGMKKQRALLHTFGFSARSRGLDPWVVSFDTEFQYVNKTLVDRLTYKRVNVSALRLAEFQLGYDFLNGRYGSHVILSAGASRFWDPAIPVHRKSGSAYDLYGWIVSLGGSFHIINAEIRLSRNDAVELKKLVEASDHLMLEGRLSLML